MDDRTHTKSISRQRPLKAAAMPALRAWRDELRAGRRTRFTFDPLWRAACAEMAAVEAVTPESADRFLREARRLIQAAARGAA